jgi:hypothetical protein
VTSVFLVAEMTSIFSIISTPPPTLLLSRYIAYYDAELVCAGVGFFAQVVLGVGFPVFLPNTEKSGVRGVLGCCWERRGVS